MTPRKIVLLGSTGSIGRSTLDVIRQHPGHFDVIALAAHANVDLLLDQYRRFRPEYVCLIDPAAAKIMSDKLSREPVEVLSGEADMIALAGRKQADIVVNAVVGAAGLRASLETIRAGKYLALANKESLVAGGPLFGPLIKKSGGKILPIDSEHSAIWQTLTAGKPEEVANIILTASGGPFRDYPIERFSEITPEQALAHPTWKMGPKITIDSATMVNKGLEVIEAATLFSIPVEKIKVVIHPQSIVHSMVEFIDSSIIAQLSRPDMRLPITYALFWPQRVQSDFGRLSFDDLLSLSFEKPDFVRFPALRLAFSIAGQGGTAPAVYSAANEVAVGAFLRESVKFSDISDIIEDTVAKMDVVTDPSLEDILQADREARRYAGERTGQSACC
ncbi:MAG: 1-deoxy-D-xylulose-5-phosphate reductoisomerase [bacterium]